jgi:ubiquinone/menaquinone biosynthesis C-methylase UbiE
MKQNAITTDWFNKWANYYDCSLGQIGYHKQLLELAVKVLKVKTGHKVLDVGCGTGLLSLKILQQTDCKITGIDCSGEMLNIFEDKINKLKLGDKINCMMMDAATMDFEKNTFDKIAATVALHHIKNKRKLLKSAYKILKPGGSLVIGEVDMDTTGNHNDADRLRRILRVLEVEWIYALKHAGKQAFIQMYDNAKKHIFNDGEYCISLKQWAQICKEIGFKDIIIRKVPDYKIFGVVRAKK